MTYNTNEISAQDGAPVELYEFEVAGVTYRYTSGALDYEWDTRTYEAMAMERGELADTGELPKNDLEITVPRDFPIAEMFRVAPPDDVVIARLREVHRTDGAQEAIIKWSGRVLSVGWPGATAILYCENDYTSMKRSGLRRSYSRQCPHILYGSKGCRLDKADYREDITLSTVSGTELVSSGFAAFADGYFDGGYVEFERTVGRFEPRAIRSHIGNTVILTHAISDLTGGNVVRAYPGCDHTYATCQSKFGNTDNFGGFPNMGQKNPFGQNSVF